MDESIEGRGALEESRPVAASLPVVQPWGLRPRRPSRWRTVALVAVHVAMIAHLVQWRLAGETLSPVEPSEAMELAKHGVVNTGLVFFAAAIVTTAIFGRFFCGWGCHLVALQDLCRWLLLKVGLRPRPLRSRALAMVPTIAFVYMFVWPAVYGFAVGERPGPLRTSFTTTEFWATFPGWTVALLTFAVCGFAVVFVLGAKGYCTYGCPYGAAFAVADRIAPVRVRVTDACAGCATCTAVCTSNVRVHEEVRRHGMVVDPGCMKCLDCVASCPNGALFVGVGRPAGRRRDGGRAPGRLASGEELGAAAVAVAAFAVYRGAYSAVPFLLSLGLAAGLAGATVALWRMIRRPDARIGPVRLRADGRLRPAGRVFAAVMVAVAAVTAHAAVSRVLDFHAAERYRSVVPMRGPALDLGRGPSSFSPHERQAVAAARSAADRAAGWSVVARPDLDLPRAWLAFLDGDDDASAELVERVLLRRPRDAEGRLLAARIAAFQGRWPDAADGYTFVIELEPDRADGYLGLGAVLAATGRVGEAREVFAAGVPRCSETVDLRYNLALADAMLGDADAAVAGFRRVLTADPENRRARENLAGVLAASGRYDEAVVVFDEAIRRNPGDALLRLTAARARLAIGDRARAGELIESAIALDPGLADARRLLD